MEISKVLLEKVKEFEGCKLYAYRDSGGTLTIGYGHTRGVKAGQAITKQQAEDFLREDLQRAFDQVEALKIPEATQGKMDALTDFVFNLGLYSLTSSTLLKKIRRCAPTEEIQEQFRRWVYCRGKVLKGLVKRREWEAERWAEE